MTWLLVTHIAILGYWLGSEFVINAGYRYVCYHDEITFADRSKLMDHVMHVDQHVRYALVLAACTGLMLCARIGYLPGSQSLYYAAAATGLGWLIFVEVVHRLRKSETGRRLAAIDRLLRYGLLIAMLLIAGGVIGSEWPFPVWLRWKIALFGGVVACGLGIRFALIAHFRTWAEMARTGATAEQNAVIKRTYVQATSVLVLLWVFISGIVVLSIVKPA
jgi:hypothetical protein